MTRRGEIADVNTMQTSRYSKNLRTATLKLRDLAGAEDGVIVAPLSILSLALAFCNPTAVGRAWWLDLVFLGFLDFMAVLRLLRGYRYQREFEVGKDAFWIYLAPYLVGFAYTLLLCLYQTVPEGQLTRCVSVLVQFVAKMSAVVALIVLFKNRAVDALYYSMVLGLVLSIFLSCSIVGVSAFFQHLVLFFSDDAPYGPYFEMHDIGLAAPMVAFFYLFIDKDRKHRSKALVMVLISLYIWKRIALIAFIALVALYLFGKAMNFKPVLAVGIGIFVAAIAWVVISGTDLFDQLILSMGINSKGRNALWEYVDVRYVDMSVTFMGYGFNFIPRLLTDIQGQSVMALGLVISGITGLHNDLLRMLIEFGFIGYLLWVAYFVFYVPNRLTQTYSKGTAWLWMLLTAYAFITYTTDNTTGYMCFQMALFLIVFVYAYANCPSCGLAGDSHQ